MVSDKQLSQKDYDSYMAFFKVVIEDRKSKKVIEENPSIIHKKDNNGYTVLHEAAYMGYCTTVEAILDKLDTMHDTASINIDVENYIGRTPLHEAARKGHGNVVQLLLDRGANPNPANYYYTPLHLAIKGEHGDVTQVLREYGGRNASELRGPSPKDIDEKKLSDSKAMTDIRIKQVAKNLKEHADSETSEKDVDTMSPSSNPRNATIKSEERSTSR